MIKDRHQVRSKFILCWTAAVLVVLMVGCRSNSASGNTAGKQLARFKKSLPATFDGLLPAASGPGRMVSLNLHAKGSVYQSTDYQNGKAPIFRAGRWEFDESGRLKVTLDSINGAAANKPDVVAYVFTDDGLQADEFDPITRGSEPFVLKRRVSGDAQQRGLLTQLTNKIWLWAGTTTPSHRIVVGNGQDYHVQFLADGKLRVRADCNSAFGTWAISDGILTITITGVSKAMCPADSLSENFLQELRSAAMFTLDGNALRIHMGSDAGTMRFWRQR